jgi:nucleoside-diphosphate-sugar epimerase
MKGVTMVTGGSGFIGVHLMSTLVEQGSEVINFDIRPPSNELEKLLDKGERKITFVQGNVLDLPTLISSIKERKVQKIVHMAALFDPQESNRIPYLTHQVNVQGTLNVLEASRIFGIERLVHISSIGVYPEKEYEPMDEKHPILIPGTAQPSHYAASKAAAEILGLTYWRNNGVKFVALRFSGVFGYGMRYSMFIKDMLENALQNKPTKFKTGGELCRDYTYVKDCVRAIVLALEQKESKLSKRIYLIGSGEVYSGKQVGDIVREMIPGARIEIGLELNEYEKKDAARRGKLEISLAKAELAFEPRFPLRQAIQDYMETYRKYHPA